MTLKKSKTEKLLSYTDEWKTLVETKDVATISKHLNSGFSFHITRDEYKIMEANKPQYVHYYFGVEGGKFKVFIIDNKADKVADHENVLTKGLLNKIHKNFLSEIDNSIMGSEEVSISLKEALDRSFRWKLFGHNWLESMMNGKYKNCNFPMIINPFKDLEKAFALEDNTHAYHFFGLKKIKNPITNKEEQDQYTIGSMEDYMIDIIITNITHKVNTDDDMFDNSCPAGTEIIKENITNYSLLSH